MSVPEIDGPSAARWHFEFAELKGDVGELKGHLNHIVNFIEDIRVEMAARRGINWTAAGVLVASLGTIGGIAWAATISPITKELTQIQSQQYQDKMMLQGDIKSSHEDIEKKVNEKILEIQHRLDTRK